MAYIQANDGSNLYFKDWGEGKPVLFVHGWCIHSDSWEYIMNELAGNGFRCIAYDQRGCGRSEQPWSGYDYDTLSSDLAAVIDQLNLDDVTLIGHSMGCGIITHYLNQNKASKISKAVLIATTTPITVKHARNPDGVECNYLDKAIDLMKNDKPAYILSLAEGFFNLKSESCNVTKETVDWAVTITREASLRACIELQKSNFFDDQLDSLKDISIPVLLQHGDMDVTAPVDLTAKRTHQLIPGSELIIYQDHAHGINITAWQLISRDILKFISRQPGKVHTELNKKRS